MEKSLACYRKGFRIVSTVVGPEEECCSVEGFGIYGDVAESQGAHGDQRPIESVVYGNCSGVDVNADQFRYGTKGGAECGLNGYHSAFRMPANQRFDRRQVRYLGPSMGLEDRMPRIKIGSGGDVVEIAVIEGAAEAAFVDSGENEGVKGQPAAQVQLEPHPWRFDRKVVSFAQSGDFRGEDLHAPLDKPR